MEVILAENYGALGFIGQVVEVKSGYARNFLIPRGIAVEAASRNAKLLKHQKALIEAKKAKLKTKAESDAQQLASLELLFKLKVTGKGRTFGSIGVRDIEKALKAKGYNIHRRQLILVDVIKTLGEFKVEAKIHTDVVVPLTIKVEGEVDSSIPVKSEQKKAADEAFEAEAGVTEQA